MSDTPRADAAIVPDPYGDLLVRADVARELERELTEARGLLLECKRAFLGYPQEARRTPLDLLRDLNRVLAKTPLNHRSVSNE